MNKKFGLVITAGALSAFLIVGSTLAWFTDKKEATNTFVMGDLSLELLENDVPEEIGLNFPDLVPGAVENKKVTVENTGSVDAWVRVKATIEYKEDTTGSETLVLSQLVDLNTTDWIEHNGFYYYKSILEADGVTNPLFNKVTIPTSWTTTMNDAEFDIDIVMEAIQSKNFYTETFDVVNLAAAWNTAIQ